VGTGRVCVWLELRDRFCVGKLGRNLASVDVKILSHLHYVIKKCYNFFASHAVCKYNATMNCVTVLHKKV
jgi:hypothetical protein